VQPVLPQEEHGEKEGHKRNHVEDQRVFHEWDGLAELKEFHDYL
jgi:hypothetical protein